MSQLQEEEKQERNENMAFAFMGHTLYLEQKGTLSHEIKEHEGHDESSDKICNADLTCYKGSWGQR